MKIIVGVILLFSCSEALCCVWKKMNSPFWESSRIPVCFVEPLQSLSEQDRRAHNNAKRAIREVLEREINGRTPYSTLGFENCEYNYRREGPNGNLPPMIRIDLSRGAGTGSSGGIGGGGQSFTDARTSACNILVDYMAQEGGKGPQFLRPSNLDKVQGNALHEFFHMFGIQHEELLMTEKDRNVLLRDPSIAIVPPLDPQSIMLRQYHSTRLTEHDVRCMQLVHSREILNYLPGGSLREPQLQSSPSAQ